MTIKNSIISGMIVLFLASCAMEDVSTETYTSKSDSTKSINVENLTGNLTISKWNKSYIEVKATKKAIFKDDASDVKILITDNEEYSIKTEYPDYFNGVSVDYLIRIPETLNIKAKLTTGNIDINGGAFASDIETQTGDIKVLNTKYTGSIKSKTGNISADIWDLTSDCNIETITGEIEANVKTDNYKEITTKVTTGKCSNSSLSTTSDGIFSIHLKLVTGIINVKN